MLRSIPRLLSIVFLVAILIPAVVSAADPPADIYMFHSDTCPHCKVVREEVLPGIREKYGDRIRLQEFEISDITNFKLTLVMEKLYQVPEEQAGVPEIFLGRTVLIGENAIRKNLAQEIDNLLKAENEKYRTLPTPEQLLALIVVEPTGAASPVTGTQPITGTAPVSASSPTSVPIGVATEPAVTAAAPNQTESAAAATSEAPATSTSVPTGSVTAIPPLTATEVTTVALATGTGDEPGGPLVRMAYFYEVGCKECDRAKYEINYIKGTYPNVKVDSFDVVKDAGLAAWLGEKYDIPEDRRLDTPLVFVGQDYLSESAVNVGNLEKLVTKYAGAGVEATWTEYESGTSVTRVAGLFGSISTLAVVGAGLIDGLNPCAFATIVFFIAYLAFVGRKSRDILITGVAFTVGVFIAYLLLGVGLLRVLEAVNFQSLGGWVYLAVALLCLVLAALSLSDFFKARKGRPEEMQMRMSVGTRRWVNKVIREGSNMRAYAAVAFVTGFIISLIELACTGQVYIIILSALSQPALRGQAYGYLVIYNLAFIVPLVVVFLLAFFGVSSEQLSMVVQRRLATVKLLTALLFLGLALWLIVSVLPMFGVRLIGG